MLNCQQRISTWRGDVVTCLLQIARWDRQIDNWVVATHIFFIFTPKNWGKMNPFWRIFFKGVETRNHQPDKNQKPKTARSLFVSWGLSRCSQLWGGMADRNGTGTFLWRILQAGMAKAKANNMMSISIELTRSSSGLLTTQNHKNWLESTGFSSRIFTQRFLLCVPLSCATDQLDVWKNTVSGAWCARVLLNRGCWNMWYKHWSPSTWSACETSTCHCHWLNSRHLIS